MAQSVSDVEPHAQWRARHGVRVTDAGVMLSDIQMWSHWKATLMLIGQQ